MHSVDRGRSSRRPNKLNLLSLTPTFPIPVSSEVLFKEIKLKNFTRSPSPSVVIAEVVSPEKQSKLFSPDNLLGERLSLVSNDSANSINENEKNCQSIDQQDNICLQLSDWLIQSMEEQKWREITEHINFKEEVDLTHLIVPHLKRIDDDNQLEENCYSPEYQQEEGNSVFYANSNNEHIQMLTSSRIYDVTREENSTPINKDGVMHTNSTTNIRRYNYKLNINDKALPALNQKGDGTSRITRIDGLHNLIYMLAETATFQNSMRHSELLDFEIPNMQLVPQTWRPPKKKFIFEKSKLIDGLTRLALQKYRCAGCGLNLDPKLIKKSIYCHYYSKLFCACCHQGIKARIPARILHEWDFKEYPVCDTAHKFLTENADQPVFNIRLINPELYKKAKNLRKFRKLRIKISHMWPFVQMCKVAADQITEHGILRTIFSSVPKRFFALESVDVFSLLDFERIANRNLIELIEPLAESGAAHIENCERCRHNAFLCQLCMDPNDLIFPFQLERCYRCDGCGSLTHLKCFRKIIGFTERCEDIKCEKCERIWKKKFLLRQRSASRDYSQSISSN